MRIYQIAAPEGLPGATRPLLLVKYAGEIQAYARYRDGHYEFPVDHRLGDEIDQGLVTVDYVMDDDFPVGIVLTDVDIVSD